MDKSVQRTMGTSAPRRGTLPAVRSCTHTHLAAGLFGPDSPATSGLRPASPGRNSSTAPTAPIHTCYMRRLPFLPGLVRLRMTIPLVRTSSYSSRSADRASSHPLSTTYHQGRASENSERSRSRHKARSRCVGFGIWTVVSGESQVLSRLEVISRRCLIEIPKQRKAA